MTTTTIRLPDELKERVARMAEARGLTPHAFILHAIEERTSEEEEQVAFHALAMERLAEYRASGEAVPWEDARRYLEARAAGRKLAAPKARKLKR